MGFCGREADLRESDALRGIVSSTKSGKFVDEPDENVVSSSKQAVYEDEPHENEKPAPKGWLFSRLHRKNLEPSGGPQEG